MASPLSHILHADPNPAPPPPTSINSSLVVASIQNQHHQSQQTHHQQQAFAPPLIPSSGGAQGSSLPAHTTTSAPAPLPPTSTPRSHASNASLYQCADCLRRYSRPEHLQRHIATHTLGKRFICDVCGKAFGRADLLKRHRANHDENNNSTKRRRINSSPSAGRVAHACLACAKARVKCEESKPCTRCRNRNLSCEYASSEAGSAAAMHLLHLSANGQGSTSAAVSSVGGHSVQDTSPQSYHSMGSVQHQALGAPPPPPQMMNSMHPIIKNESPVLAGSQQPLGEEAQLPTPETMMEQNNSEACQNNGMLDMARLPFSDFLRDILYEQSLESAKMEEAQGLAVLDFNDDSNLELTDIDFGLLDTWNVDGMLASNTNIPDYRMRAEDPTDMSKMRQRLVKVWTESPWRFIPGKTDSGYCEQNSLPLPSGDTNGRQFQESRMRVDRVITDKMEPPSRDKILAIVLSTCKSNAIMARVASSFPSTDVMDSLVHIFLASHLCQISEWIHYGSFALNAQWPEWLAVAASAGAILTPIQTLRKFGFALQEAVRITIPARFEDNNLTIEDIGLVQALVLGQDIGLWSGNRRKMEIAECHVQIPIAMMRGRGVFQRSTYTTIYVDPNDEGDVLEGKWKKWYRRESWKRLAFHAYLRDAQTSMTTLTNPVMSYAELTLPLPEARELWFAKSALEWKMHYIERQAAQSKRPPSLGDLFRDINLLAANHQRLDVQYALSIYLHGFWSLIWEYRQLNGIHRSSAQSPNPAGNPSLLLLSSRHQELCKSLQDFQLVTSGWHEMLSAQESLLLNLLMLYLHVSLDDLQLFSGKEGEDQARRVYPNLQQWSNSPEARQALWHAGQVLRYAKSYPPGHLKDFHAVAVHHAALALWTHGVITKATRRNAVHVVHEPVYLDGLDSNQVHRFTGFGQGRPAVRGPSSQQPGETSVSVSESYLEDTKSCMDVVEEILRTNFQTEDQLPPIVENLCHLIKQLGNAAWAVGLT